MHSYTLSTNREREEALMEFCGSERFDACFAYASPPEDKYILYHHGGRKITSFHIKHLDRIFYRARIDRNQNEKYPFFNIHHLSVFLVFCGIDAFFYYLSVCDAEQRISDIGAGRDLLYGTLPGTEIRSPHMLCALLGLVF